MQQFFSAKTRLTMLNACLFRPPQGVWADAAPLSTARAGVARVSRLWRLRAEDISKRVFVPASKSAEKEPKKAERKAAALPMAASQQQKAERGLPMRQGVCFYVKVC
jgi:hypothetical protein